MSQPTRLLLRFLPLGLSLAGAFSLMASADTPAAPFYGITAQTPPSLKLNPGPKYWARTRMWQGIPGIERTVSGRLWATWYAGPVAEGEEGNYALLVTSDDDGQSWSKPVAVFDPATFLDGRTCDPHLWRDPQGRLWWFVSRTLSVRDPNGAKSVWGFCAIDPENPATGWRPPIFAGYGVALNKPTVLSTGEWLRPVDTFNSKQPDTRTQLYRSGDLGKTYTLLSTVAIRDVVFPEHMIVERRDGTLRLFARTSYGIAQADSADRGATWANDRPFTRTMNVNTRFFIVRLNSGRWLLVANDHPKQRARMTAFLSDDEGETWPHKLMLDERGAVSYPDAATEDGSGFLYIVYDRGRYLKGQQEILFAKITEADILAGSLVSAGSRLTQKISRLEDEGGGVREDWESSKLVKQHEASR